MAVAPDLRRGSPHLLLAVQGQFRIVDAGILAGPLEDDVELGLAVADQDHAPEDPSFNRGDSDFRGRRFRIHYGIFAFDDTAASGPGFRPRSESAAIDLHVEMPGGAAQEQVAGPGQEQGEGDEIADETRNGQQKAGQSEAGGIDQGMARLLAPRQGEPEVYHGIHPDRAAAP